MIDSKRGREPNAKKLELLKVSIKYILGNFSQTK